MVHFVVDSILSKEDICNLDKDFQFLLKSTLKGDHVVFYGRRNMGKTSLVLSKLVPEFNRHKKKPLVIVIDLLGVQSEQEVEARIKTALENALVSAFPTQTKLKNITTAILGLRPTIQIDGQTGEVKLSLDAKIKGQEDLSSLFFEIRNLTKTCDLLIVFDEFQDIVNIKSMDAKFRTEMQKLPPKLPMVIMGSKKHLLSQLFSLPKAPLAGWGIDYEISTISPTEFAPYLNQRFKPFNKKISLVETEYLCKKMEFIPEAIIYACMTICEQKGSSAISIRDIDKAISETVALRRGRYEESLQVFTKAERQLMKILAKLQPVKNPTGKDFIHETQLSSAGIIKIVQKLENLALIYRSSEGISISDPLLATYIRNHW